MRRNRCIVLLAVLFGLAGVAIVAKAVDGHSRQSAPLDNVVCGYHMEEGYAGEDGDEISEAQAIAKLAKGEGPIYHAREQEIQVDLKTGAARLVDRKSPLTKAEQIDRAGYAGNALALFFKDPKRFCSDYYECRTSGSHSDACVIHNERCRFTDTEINDWLEQDGCEDNPVGACFDAVNAQPKDAGRDYTLCYAMAKEHCDICFVPVPEHEVKP